MAVFGTFDASKHPRVSQGQHGGGEFSPDGGAASPAAGGGGAGTAPPYQAPVVTDPPQGPAPAPDEVVKPGTGVLMKPLKSRRLAADDDQTPGQMLAHRAYRAVVGAADDVVLIALHSIVQAHPDWFSIAGHLVKSVDGAAGALECLAKFDAGQPRDEDGKWVVAGATAAGGTVAAGGTALAVHLGRRQAFSQARQAVKPILQARTAVKTEMAQRASRRERVAATVERRLKTATGFLPTAIRATKSQARRSLADIASHMAEHSQPFWPEGDEPVWASTDAVGEWRLRNRADSLHERLTDLKENGRARRRVGVAKSVHEPKVAEYNRTIRGPMKFIWKDPGRPVVQRGLRGQRPKNHVKADPEKGRLATQDAIDWARAQPGASADLPKTVDELETHIRQVPRKYWPHYLEGQGLTIEIPGTLKPYIDQVVRNARRVIPAHTRNVDGHPDRAGRKAIADDIHADLIARRTAAAASDRSAVRFTSPVTAARVSARNNSGLSAMRRLAQLRIRGRAAAIGAGVAGAALAGGAAYAWLKHRQQSPMAKAFNPGQVRDAKGRWSAGQPTVTVLIGSPASGKSTWRAANRPNATVISTDAILQREGLPTTSANIDAALKIARGEFRDAAAAGMDIVLDRTNPTVKSRGRWLSTLPPGYRKEAVVFDTHGLERAWQKVQRPGIADARLRYEVPIERPAAGEFDHVETVKRGASQGSIAWARARRPQSPMAKAAPENDEPDPAQAVFDAGAEVEKPLAENIAAAFGNWSRIPAALLTNQTAGLRGLLATSMVKALAPLDDAAEGGAAAEVPVVTQDTDGRNRIVGISLDTGSDKVVRFSQAYRVKLAGQMADEQFQTLQTVLRDATLNGQPPAKTARLLRQVIGLTPVQAGYVTTYRRALMALDPNALNRALRDARYDPTVSRAIQTNTPLSEDQVNAMVDAYHRRSLALRAMTIARTEGVGAANNGHADAVADFLDKSPGFTVIKTWMSTADDHTRPDHRALNGQQVVGLYTAFVAPSGDTLMWPHDPNAPLRQRVSCRCSWGCALVPRTAAAHRGFTLTADSPWEVAGGA